MSLSRQIVPYEHWEYLDLESKNSLRIVPERGGVITSWICQGREMFYFDQYRFMDSSKSIRGGMPILFPICGDLPDNKFYHNNKEYLIYQHGFARNYAWELNLLNDNNGIIITLTDNKETLLSYPFKFSIEMEIRLVQNSLDILSRVTNKSTMDMPFCYGLHPYFFVNSLQNVNIYGLDEECIDQINMSKIKTNLQLQKLSEGVDFITKSNNLCCLFDKVDNTVLELSSEEPYGFNVIWTDPPREMVCLEPWTSPRNSLISQDNLILLSPGLTQNLRCKFTLNQIN